MVKTTLPKVNMETAETGCCPRFDPGPWDDEEFQFQDRLFVRARTVNFLHIPLNIGPIIKKTWAKIQAADAAASDEFLMLSTDVSASRGEHYFAVIKDVPDAEMVRLSGTFLTKVYEGPYREARNWVRDIERHVAAAGRDMRRLFFFYTTCPKCAKHFGKNYVVAFAEV